MSFASRIKDLKVEKGSVALVWVGQAGFLLKTASGKIIAVDPYLSDYVYECEKETMGLGYKRVTAPLFEPDEIHFDVLLASHEHGDHLDIPSIPQFLEYHYIRFLTNSQSIAAMKKNGIEDSRIEQIKIGDTVDFDDFQLRVTDCDHGPSTPGAMGFILDFGFTKIYYSGDTSYSLDRLQQPIAEKPQIALLPINGAYGNLDHETAAKYAALLGSKVCIPHHFWTFPRHMGDPFAAIECFKKEAPGCELRITTPGIIHIIK